MIPHEGACSNPLASIDIGTNTLRLLVGCIKEGELVRVASERAVTRLGRGLVTTSRLDPAGVTKSITSLVAFKQVCEIHGAGRIFAVGTSALREATDTEQFIFAVKEKTAIDIRVISGREEADLTLIGVLAGLHQAPGGKWGTLLITDVGGGSTEWILRHGTTTQGSLPLGAVRLFEGCVTHDPPTPEEICTMKSIISKIVAGSKLYHDLMATGGRAKERDASPRLIATGGTAATLAAIDLGLPRYDGDKVHGHTVPLSALGLIGERLASLPYRERCQIEGLDAERADILLPGLLIVTTLMELIGTRNMIVSDYGLLEGLLLSHG